MTSSTTSQNQWKKTIQGGVPHVDPAIITTPSPDNQVFVWTSSVNRFIQDVQVSNETENTPMQIVFNSKKFGTTIKIKIPQSISPNAAFVHQKLSNSYFVYSFGDNKYPFLLRYNLQTHKEENLNKDDALGLGDQNGISNTAKTCVFGESNEYILVNSRANELLIYSVADNKFVKKINKLESLLSDEDKENLEAKVIRYVSEPRDSNYLCKLREENEAAEFFMINDSYLTYLTIGYKDKKFTIKPRFLKNNFTNVVENNKIKHFGCYYFSDYETIMVCGGVDELYQTKEFVCFYNVRSNKIYFSKTRLPVTMAHHGIAYLKNQNWLYLIPGVRYINRKHEEITYGYYISLDAYKSILTQSKKEMIISQSKLNNKFKSNKD